MDTEPPVAFGTMSCVPASAPGAVSLLFVELNDTTMTVGPKPPSNCVATPFGQGCAASPQTPVIDIRYLPESVGVVASADAALMTNAPASRSEWMRMILSPTR